MRIRKIRLDEAPRVPFDLDGKIVFASDKTELVHLTLKPGEEVGKHSQPFDVIFYVLSGQGMLETDDGNFEGKEDTVIFAPAGMPRGWRNTGTIDFKVLVIKDLA